MMGNPGSVLGRGLTVHSEGCGTDSMMWRQEVRGVLNAVCFRDNEMHTWAKTHPETPFSKMGLRGGME